MSRITPPASGVTASSGASMRPRIAASERRSSRDTCICEMPELGGDLRLRHLPVEAELDDAPLALVQGSEPFGHDGSVRDAVECFVVEAERLRQRVLATVADGRVERTQRVRVRRVERVDHLFLVGPGRLGELGHRRRAAELSGEVVEHARELHPELLEPPGDVHRPGSVAEVTPDLAEHRRHRERGELDTSVDVEALDGVDQPDGAHLDEVLERLAAPGVPRRERSHEGQQLGEHTVSGLTVAVTMVGDQQGLNVPVHDEAHAVLEPRQRERARLPARRRTHEQHRIRGDLDRHDPLGIPGGHPNVTRGDARRSHRFVALRPATGLFHVNARPVLSRGAPTRSS